MRGEQELPPARSTVTSGSPPHARGAGTDAVPPHPADGSPPHARGAVRPGVGRGRAWGITPACAGSSTGRPQQPALRPDHPRMRGEQSLAAGFHRRSTGSPPHARGAVEAGEWLTCVDGITPACAGSRASPSTRPPRSADHPRMRGEQARLSCRAVPLRGSPPHARGADQKGAQRRHDHGITPACAGSRRRRTARTGRTRDHPRMRGEQAAPSPPTPGRPGSPPHARGAVKRHSCSR